MKNKYTKTFIFVMCFFRDKELVKRVYSDGRIEYYHKNLLHNPSGPAVIKGNHQEWWYYGMKHRKNKPAIIYEDGSCEWWFYGMRHRKKNKPAIKIMGYGFNVGVIHEEYWFYDKLHRTNGPAVCRSDGSQEWWRFGKKIK